MQQGRIGVLKGNASIPEWEPVEIAPVAGDVVGQRDIGCLDRGELIDVLEAEQLQAVIEVDCEESGDQHDVNGGALFHAQPSSARTSSTPSHIAFSLRCDA